MSSMASIDELDMNGVTDEGRKNDILSMIRDLPRRYQSEIHAVLTDSLRRDMIGSLPRELALHTFRFLDTASMLQCALVNKTWQSVAEDQMLWKNLCAEEGIAANEHTSWRDIFAEREKVNKQERDTANRTSSTRWRSEDPWDDDMDIDDDAGGLALAPGVMRNVVERERGEGSSAGKEVVTQMRRPSFRSGRNQSGLPVFLFPGAAPTNQNQASSSAPASVSPSKHYPIASHLHLPLPRPQVNYKHLYLIHQIIRQRFLKGKMKPLFLDAAESKLNGGLEGHADSIYCLQLFNQELTIQQGKPQQSSPRRASESNSSRVAIEGRKWLFSGSRDRTVRLWDLNTARVVKIYRGDPDIPGSGHTGSVLTMHVRANEDGIRMVTGGSDGKIIMWDVNTGNILGEIPAPERGESVHCVRFDDKRIVCCKKDRSIRTYDTKTLQPLLIIGGPSSNVGAQAENHLLVSAIPAPSELEGHQAAVNAIGLVKNLIISASGDRTLRIWSADTGEKLVQIDAHARGIASLDIDPETGTTVTGSSDNGIRLHELEEWGLSFEKDFTVEDIEKFRKVKADFVPEYTNGLEFIAGRKCCKESIERANWNHISEAGMMESMIVDGGMPIGERCYVCRHRGHKGLVRSLWLGQDVVFSGSYDCSIKIWDRKTGLLLTDLPSLHTCRVYSVVGDCTKVVSSGMDHRIIVWDFSNGLDTSFVDT